jgi:hypothetical protein
MKTPAEPSTLTPAGSSRRVDELFGADGVGLRPRRAAIFALVGVGLVLTVLGLGCSSAPGGLIVLAGWSIADDDAERIRAGALPLDEEPAVRARRNAALAALVLVIAVFVLQLALLSMGFYEQWWSELIALAFPVEDPA